MRNRITAFLELIRWVKGTTEMRLVDSFRRRGWRRTFELIGFKLLAIVLSVRYLHFLWVDRQHLVETANTQTICAQAHAHLRLLTALQRGGWRQGNDHAAVRRHCPQLERMPACVRHGEAVGWKTFQRIVHQAWCPDSQGSSLHLRLNCGPEAGRQAIAVAGHVAARRGLSCVAAQAVGC